MVSAAESARSKIPLYLIYGVVLEYLMYVEEIKALAYNTTRKEFIRKQRNNNSTNRQMKLHGSVERVHIRGEDTQST
jgi:hypothetical protein